MLVKATSYVGKSVVVLCVVSLLSISIATPTMGEGQDKLKGGGEDPTSNIMI